MNVLRQKSSAGIPDECRLVLLCRKVRRMQRRALSKKGLDFGGMADLKTLEGLLDHFLATYDSDKILRGIKW